MALYESYSPLTMRSLKSKSKDALLRLLRDYLAVATRAASDPAVAERWTKDDLARRVIDAASILPEEN